MAMVLMLNWWTLALRGLLAIVVGLLAFFMPVATLFALTYLFGAYALIDGILSLTSAIRGGRQGEHWWEFLFEGILGLAAATAAMISPALTLTVLIYIVAAWAVVTGITKIAAAIRLRRHITGEWLLGLAGLFSVLFGVLLFAAPGPGAVVLAWWMGTYIFLFGIVMLILAFRLRRWSAGAVYPLHA